MGTLASRSWPAQAAAHVLCLCVAACSAEATPPSEVNHRCAQPLHALLSFAAEMAASTQLLPDSDAAAQLAIGRAYGIHDGPTLRRQFLTCVEALELTVVERAALRHDIEIYTGRITDFWSGRARDWELALAVVRLAVIAERLFQVGAK